MAITKTQEPEKLAVIEVTVKGSKIRSAARYLKANQAFAVNASLRKAAKRLHQLLGAEKTTQLIKGLLPGAGQVSLLPYSDFDLTKAEGSRAFLDSVIRADSLLSREEDDSELTTIDFPSESEAYEAASIVALSMGVVHPTAKRGRVEVPFRTTRLLKAVGVPYSVAS